MKPGAVLAVYNRYVKHGGEDVVFESDVDLLRRKGWSVEVVTEQTRPPDTLLGKGRFALRSMWSREWYAKIEEVLSRARPSIVHVYNTFPAISPSVYHACWKHNVPVVLTVQNYRLICPKATLYRDGEVCELCVGRGFPWPGVRHACYHGSRVETAVVGSVVAAHRMLGTWNARIALYLAPTEFTRQKLVAGGLPEQKVVLKPNFCYPDPGAKKEFGTYALFVGRLSAEKGVPTLLAAWSRLADIPLVVAGDGPLEAEVLRLARASEGCISYRGRCTRAEILSLMKGAYFLVFPSEWYEGLPMTIIEALACGLPIVATRLGAMQEIIGDGVTGVHYEAGDAADLARAVRWCVSNPSLVREIGKRARVLYEKRYTANDNYSLLRVLYRRAIEHSKP